MHSSKNNKKSNKKPTKSNKISEIAESNKNL